MKAIIKAAVATMLLSSASLALAQNTNEDSRQIVVTARPLADTEAALKACIARGCSPDEDIKATLAHAENQFVEGQYRNARSTLNASLNRNRKYGGKYPVEVSDLLRANGNVAAHLGESDSYRLSVLDMRNTLKAGLPDTDYRILGAELEVGDSRLRLGYPDEAKRKYEEVEARATAIGLPYVAAMARLRKLSMLVLVAQSVKDNQSISEANTALDAYIAKPTPGAEQYGIVAQVLKSRLDRIAGKTESTDELIARFAALGGTTKPILIFAKPYELNEESAARAAAGGSDLNRLSTSNVENRWIDVGFWINGDGKVEEPEILRSKGPLSWTKDLLKSIQTRQYTPTKKDADGNSPGFYAVERYTLTAFQKSDVTGTHLRKRSPILRIEQIDLSDG